MCWRSALAWWEIAMVDHLSLGMAEVAERLFKAEAERDALAKAAAEAVPVATAWVHDGKMVNAFPGAPCTPAQWAEKNHDGYWSNKGYSEAPLYALPPSAARAFEIADEAMFERLLSEGVLTDGIDSTCIGFVDESCQEVHALAQACPAMREAFEWLQPRGYVDLGSDKDGEFINVCRRPGEDS